MQTASICDFLHLHKTSNKYLCCLFVHVTKTPCRLIETRRLLETWRLFVSCTNGKILVPISQGN